MSTVRVVNLQHPDSVEPNVILNTDGTATFASGVTVSGFNNISVSGTAVLASGTAASPSLTFEGDSDTGLYSPTGNTLAITTSGTEHVRIDSDGLKFNGDTAAVNALDDYEEGTFTPTLRDATAYTYQDGDYTKIGDMVYFYIRIKASASTPSNQSWVIQGLPFTSANDDVFGGAWRSYGRNVFSSTASDAVNFHIGKNSSNIQCRLGANGTSQVATNNTSFVSLNEEIILQGFYKPAGG